MKNKYWIGLAATVLVAVIFSSVEAAEFFLDRVPEGRTPIPAGAFSAKQGTVMLWTTCDSRTLTFVDAADRAVLDVHVGGVLPGFRVAMQDGTARDYTRRCAFGEKDTAHFAFTWREGDGNCRVFVNGLPYENYFTCGERSHWNIASNRLDEVRAIAFARKDPKHVFDWERLFITDRVLSNREIAEAYRARMPLDFVTVDSVFYANEPAGPSVVLAPGGTFTRPNPVEGYTNITATGDVTLELFDRKPLVGGAVRTPLAVKTFKNLAVVRETDIAFDPVTVAPGLYDVRLTLRLPTGTVYRRTRPYSATERFDASSVKTAAEPWQKGELVYAKSFRAPADMDFTDGVPVAVRKRAHLWPWRRAEAPCADYLEGDSRGGKRMAVVMTIPPEAANNETLLLEIDWPDDKPRSMGLYMYPEGGCGVRDRLQMGIQAGREYPETFKMQTAAYPIYATKTNLLLELRTMVQGWPAAVSAVRIYRLAQPLPKLALNLPKGEKGRSLGHLDEDQTFYNNLGRQATGPVVNELIRYFNYTGQNAIVYPMIRYYFGFCAAEGPLDGNGMFPGRQGEFSYVLRTLKENGIEFTGRMSLFNVPDVARLDRVESTYREQGMVQLDKDGLDRALYNIGDFQANPANPKCWRLCLDYFRDLYERYGRCGLDSICWAGFGRWHGDDFGYDDWTVRAFFRETGLAAPEGMLEEAKTKADFNARYAYLTNRDLAVSSAWFKWRSEKTAAFYRYMIGRIRAFSPDLTVYLGADDDEQMRELLKIPGVAGFPYGRNVTGFRWQLHRGMEEDDGYYNLYRSEQPELKRLERIQGALPMFQTGGCYFETFTKSLDMKRFPCTFQDADVKPWGRWWLKEYAFALAKTDALKIVSGEQPLHTLGNEVEIREFARAYRPLPARPFATVAGSGDPITIRVLETKGGLYLYAVNIHHTPVKAILPKEMNGTELSDGAELAIGCIALRGCELRSFFIPHAKAADVSSFRVELSDASRHAYDRRLEVLEEARATFDAHGLAHEKEDAIIEGAVRAWRAGALNMAHQEFFRKELNGMLAKLDNLEYVIAEARLSEQGIFRVNCGQTGWEMIEGNLFSPDKSWDGATYGHVIFKCRSGQNSTVRDTTKMECPVRYAKVFETEAFDIDEYVFNVQKPGRYRLTLYMKVGWRAAMIPNWFHTEVLANGTPLFEPYLDLYESQGHDFNRPVVKTFEVEVGADGLLRLELKCPSEYYLFMLRKPNTTTRLMNAITVERLD